MSEDEALKYIKQISEALITVHSKGLLHRDIKPSNIIIRANDSEAVLIDFGIAKEFIPEKTQQFINHVSSGYSALEQYDGKGTYSSDVYSLAATLYYMLTSQHPINALYRKHKDNLIEPQDHNSEISDTINQFILRGLILEAKNRPQSIREWLDSIDKPWFSGAEIHYKTLKKLLDSRQWKKADQETTKIILQLCDPGDIGFLIPEDLKQIPCADFWKPDDKLYGDRYTIVDILGIGGFGIVFLAKDNQDREVVIKTLNSELQKREDFDKICKNFSDEARQLGFCQHPNIVKIENSFTQNNLPCIVMEYVEGETIDEYVKKQGKFSEDQAVKYIKQISEALITVHNKGLLHRDIKPSNIIIRAHDSEAVLIDFGIAKEFIPEKTQQFTSHVSGGYSPLEQYDRQGTYSSDVYSLAATLYYMLTGQRPSNALYRKHNDNLIEPQDHNSEISDTINQFILRGLILEAKNRPQSIREWLDSIDKPWFSGAEIHYKTLKKLLDSRQWEKADQETTKIILTLCNQEDADYLLPEDLKQIPCADLWRIDKLWKDYSNNLYGFSIQAKVWENFDNNIFSNKQNWLDFTIQVGWYMKVFGFTLTHSSWCKRPSGFYPTLLHPKLGKVLHPGTEKKLLDALRQKEEYKLIGYRRDLAETIAKRKYYERQYNRYLSTAHEWEKRSELALSKGHTTLAKEAKVNEKSYLRDAEKTKEVFDKIKLKETEKINNLRYFQYQSDVLETEILDWGIDILIERLKSCKIY